MWCRGRSNLLIRRGINNYWNVPWGSAVASNGNTENFSSISSYQSNQNHYSNGIAMAFTASLIAAASIMNQNNTECRDATSSARLVRYKSDLEMNKIYRVGTVIGEGSFGVVKLGIDRKSLQKVAIKELPKNANVLEAIDHEVHMMSSAGPHEGIISLRDVYDAKEKMYIVLEFAEGGELIQKIIADGQFPETQAVDLFVNVVFGLRHMHRKGIAHLDIKPENLLLTQDKKLKIADFGLSLNLDECENFLNVDIGTPAYAAPELLRGESFSEKVDIWALGCVLYIMLCGVHPFDPCACASDEEMRDRSLCAAYDTENESYKNLSNEAKDLIGHMLDVNPQARYSADQVLVHDWVQKLQHGDEVLLKRSDSGSATELHSYFSVMSKR